MPKHVNLRDNFRLRMWVGRLRIVGRFVGMLFIFAFATLAITELLNHSGSLSGIMQWVAERPGVVMLNLGLLMSAICFLVFLLNALDAGCQLGAVLIILPVLASFFKERWLHEPLVPSDFVMVKQLVSLVPRLFAPGPAIIAATGTILALFVMGVVLRRTTRMRFSLAARIIACAGSAAIPALLSATPPSELSLAFADANRGGSIAPLDRYYQQWGFAVSFTAAMGPRGQAIPEGYSNLEVETVIHQVATEYRRLPRPKVQPDVVVVMSESFWDPTRLPGVRFSRDPLPVYHALSQSAGQADFLSPSVGGMTANTEFEFLTGMSMRFLQTGSAPYLHDIGSAIPAVPRVLQAQGYSTVAVHPYLRSFWNRDQVYPLLGFDRFDGVETFSEIDMRGGYVTDQALTRRITDELDAARQPLFVFAISMQNHGPYRKSDLGADDIKVTANLPGEQVDTLQTLCRGLKDADASLGTLVEHLKRRSRPTVLVFFGDHLPSLGNGYAVFKDTGFVGGDTTADEQARLHSVPSLIWTNFPCNMPSRGAMVSPQMVWPDVLRAVGIAHPFYTTFLSQVRSAWPGLSRSVCIDGAQRRTQHTPQGDRVLQSYQMLQYDMLFGRRYGQGMFGEMQ